MEQKDNQKVFLSKWDYEFDSLVWCILYYYDLKGPKLEASKVPIHLA